MASKHTTNYKLSQWESTDSVLREDFNADNAAIEAALSDHDAKITAAQAKITSVHSDAQTKLNAARTDLEGQITQLENDTGDQVASLRSTLNSLQSKMNALQNQLNNHPTYKVGVLDGYNGSAAVTVNLGKQPKMVMVGNRLGWTNSIDSTSTFCYCAHAVAMPGHPGYESYMVGDYGTEAILSITSTGFTLEAGMKAELAPYYYLALL